MAAPKGNKFALGNEAKPKTFNSPKHLQETVDDYFNWADLNPIQVVAGLHFGKPVYVANQRPYTVEGLADYLGCDRKTLLNYQKKDGYEEYFHIITRAKEKIKRQRVEYAMIGVYKEGFTKFLLMNDGDYAEKVDHKVQQETVTTFNLNIVPEGDITKLATNENDVNLDKDERFT